MPYFPIGPGEGRAHSVTVEARAPAATPRKSAVRILESAPPEEPRALAREPLRGVCSGLIAAMGPRQDLSLELRRSDVISPKKWME